MLATLLIVVMFWDGPRLLVLGGATAVYLALGAGLLVAWRRKSRSKPPLLSATLAELKRDRDALVGHPAGPV